MLAVCACKDANVCFQIYTHMHCASVGVCAAARNLKRVYIYTLVKWTLLYIGSR